MTLIFLDTETTGLDPLKSSIVQLNGIIKDSLGNEREFNYYIKPYRGEVKIDAIVTNKTGYTLQQMQSWMDVHEVFKDFKSLITKYVDINDFSSRAFIVGYNVRFDTDMLRSLFNYVGDKDYGRLFSSPDIEVMTLASIALLGYRPHMKNFKLTTVYEKIFGEWLINANDPLADVKATKRLFEKVANTFVEPLMMEERKRLARRRI